MAPRAPAALALYCAVRGAIGAPRVSPKPNIILLLTDDQDVRLGSMRALPYTLAHLGGEGVNLTNFFVNTPICCPSRATLLSGRMNHNNKARSYETSGSFSDPMGMCMRMNTSQTLNPGYWKSAFVRELHYKHGYATGLFGKVLNDMSDYGCDNKSTTEGVDRMFVMCKTVYYDEEWIDRGAPDSPTGTNKTGNSPQEYTTSLMGNATLRWIKSVVSSKGAQRRPFFAWIGVHAPHLPSTPAPWYMDHPVGNLGVIQEPNYGFLGADKHAFFPLEPIISDDDAAAIQLENSKRLRSLLSVDDLVRELREYLVAAGEWDNTLFLFTSDHGYSLGGFRVDSKKEQVYDHNTRVPLLMHVPRGVKGEVDIPVAMVDIAPTLLEFAGGAEMADAMDGLSFASQVRPGGSAPALPWPRDAVLLEYQSVLGGPSESGSASSPAYEASCASAFGYHEDEGIRKALSLNNHINGGPTNTYSALRYTRGSLGELLYAEFANVSDPRAWNFAPDRINFYELYNMTEDPFMLRNMYHEAPRSLAEGLHQRLHRAIACRGAADCTASLSASSGPDQVVV